MRLPSKRCPAVDAFWASDEESAVVTLNPSSEQRRDCCDQDLSPDPLPVRLVGVRLKGGDTEVLVTSISDKEHLPARLFGPLYHRRWSTKKSYKRQKRWLEIENISSHSVLAVRQDVHAKILVLNLTAMLLAVAQLIAAHPSSNRANTPTRSFLQYEKCPPISRNGLAIATPKTITVNVTIRELAPILHSIKFDTQWLSHAQCLDHNRQCCNTRPDLGFQR